MRLLSLFTSRTTVSPAILAIAALTSFASAQDRTTEQGEAQITGEHSTYSPVVPGVSMGRKSGGSLDAGGEKSKRLRSPFWRKVPTIVDSSHTQRFFPSHLVPTTFTSE